MRFKNNVKCQQINSAHLMTFLILLLIYTHKMNNEYYYSNKHQTSLIYIIQIITITYQ